MNSRERLKLTLKRKIPDRIPRIEIAFWPETVERWKKEGLPEKYQPFGPFLSGVENEYRMNDTLDDYFGLDRIAIISFDASMRFKEEVLEETDEVKIYTTGDGLTYKALKNVTVPASKIDTVIKSRDDWEMHKGRLKPSKDRISEAIPAFCKHLEEKDIFTVISPMEPCQYALYLLDEAECLMNMAADPDFIEDIMAYYNEFTLGMLEIMLGQGVRPDAVWVFSDLCYRNGMLFSPAFFRERVMKYQKELFGFCKSRGIDVIYHCDGYIAELLPLLIEAGINCIQPMEARAGNDVREYKRLYGDRIAFMGNISADVLAEGDKEAIEREIRDKITVAKENSGYIYHSDHSIPPTISLESYRYAMELVEKYGKY